MSAVVESINAAQSPEWRAPQPLITSERNAPYPLEALSDTIRRAVKEVHAYVQSPIPLIAQSALTAAAIAVQAHYNVARDSSLEGPCSLFMLAVGESGERKTSGDGYFMKAVQAHEESERERVKPEQTSYRADHSAWEAKQSALIGNIKGLAKAGKPTDGIEGQLRKMEAEEPLPPMYQKILFTDATPEALIYRLATLWPSGAICSDEAGSVLGSHGMGADSQMRNLSTLNSLWGGHTLNVDRRTSESFTLTNARLSMALQVQKSTLMHFIERTGQLARGSGFFARFLLAVPESTQGKRPYKTPPANWPSLSAFNQRIEILLSREVSIQNGILQPVSINLTDDAKAKWIEYHDTIEAELVEDGDFEELRDAASKIAENATRLACIFELMENPDATTVSLEMMERAISLATWHVYEAKRFFNEIALPEPLRLAATLDAWLVKRCRSNRLTRVSRRDAQRGPHVFKDGKKLDIAIQELVDTERVRVNDSGRSIMLIINPRLLEQMSS